MQEKAIFCLSLLPLVPLMQFDDPELMYTPPQPPKEKPVYKNKYFNKKTKNKMLRSKLSQS